MVLRHGSCPKTIRTSEDLCRFETSKWMCSERISSITTFRRNINSTNRSLSIHEAGHQQQFLTHSLWEILFSQVTFINSAPELFQGRMNVTLSGLPGVLCLMDNVLDFGKTQAEHDAHLEAVLKWIKSAGVILNHSKSEFLKSELKFLGHIINTQGVKANPAKQKYSHLRIFQKCDASLAWLISCPSSYPVVLNWWNH